MSILSDELAIVNIWRKIFLSWKLINDPSDLLNLLTFLLNLFDVSTFSEANRHIGWIIHIITNDRILISLFQFVFEII